MRNYLLKSLERTVENLPRVLEDWPSYDNELEDHYTASLTEILIDSEEFKEDALPFLRIIWDMRVKIDSVMGMDIEGLFAELGFDFSND